MGMGQKQYVLLGRLDVFDDIGIVMVVWDCGGRKLG